MNHYGNRTFFLRFGKNVQEIRRSKQLSQEKLAELAGVHRTYIGMVERAEKNITLCNIEKIVLFERYSEYDNSFSCFLCTSNHILIIFAQILRK